MTCDSCYGQKKVFDCTTKEWVACPECCKGLRLVHIIGGGTALAYNDPGPIDDDPVLKLFTSTNE